MIQSYEKLGAFYLGKEYDPASRTLKEDLILYDAKDLNTHAVIIGMTGSGKTGLGIGILEEAEIENPARLIAPVVRSAVEQALSQPSMKIDPEDAF